MTVDFGDYFWGEKNNGFTVLYQNMKHGLVASKEFADFLRERSNIEENNSKLLAKLAKQTSSGSVQGTFAPVWQVLRSSAEKLSNLHMQMVQKVTELVKEVSKYAEELHKKHKLVKEEEGSTLEVVQAIQSTTLILQKAKDTYTQRGLEYEKLKKENASPKDLEKAEIKLKKAQEEYKALIEKYKMIKEEFERKMILACRHFQEIEEAHVKQMKEFLNTYADDLQHNHDLIGQIHIDFKRQCLEMTVEKLLEQFVLTKYTGLERPCAIEFEEFSISGLSSITSQAQDSSEKTTNGEKPSKKEGNLDCAAQKPKESKTSRRTTSLLNLFMSSSQGSSGNPEGGSLPTSAPTSPTTGAGVPPTGNATSLARNPLRGSKWFLRSRREKRKEKKAKKKKDGMDNTSSKEEKSDVEDKDDNRKSETPTPEVDEEGYCIKPKPDPWENDKGSFYSSSDTDSDDEREHKIHVEIKPLSNGSAPMSASVDELRATVENLSLSPVATVTARRDSAADPDSHIKRSQSVSQQLGGKPSSDLLGLNLFQSPTASSASTPTGNHPYAPLHSPTQPTVSSPAPSTSSSRYADLGDLFSEVGEMQQPALPPKQSRQTPTPTQGTIAIPRPPSRRGEGPSTRGRMSPAPIARADSVGSLEFRTAGVPVGSSRGPSPLTIGMADTIPLAVAFHEIVHSYFRGTDETKCQVKLSGDMMLSFPAGIVAVLANNPSPAQLSFRIRNTHRLEDMLPNKQLVTIDSAQSSHDSTVFDFNMNALTALLRRQSDQNPSASYFNVDILKYKIKPKSGAGSCPFQLVAYWKCESSHTDLRIDYKYNSHAMSSASPLLNLTVAVPVDGGVKNMQSKPNAQWQPENNRALWKFTELSQHSENHGVGSLRARLEVTNGPSNQSTIATQFNCEGTTLSGLEFELVGAGYRLSLVKRRFVSGKYICDGDPDPRNRYATPPGSEC
ncbi:F-BAR domain only protein 2 isoform X2 [Schistocerca gregaria]|uniref:F-BAR domain only protein 2 isoform X2 n=1 Tax=Schistocerca gregaria TaxID=7010 RepID=UPI00211EC082|nr:F-BAR domain only protein 2 isoform X2 [Schistocerca gregaria]